MSRKPDSNQRIASPRPAGEYTLRIIGGQWRGSKLHFPQVSAIRPTPDRVRETLFNWLQHDIIGARCLDLFAGSGALGLEALSRGAAQATFVDTETLITRYLRDTLARLGSKTGEVIQSDALTFLANTTSTFDVVFMDPPFALTADSNLFAKLFALLQQPGRLSDVAWVYLECPAALGTPDQWPCWPSNHWHCHRSKQAGQVGYHLLRITPSQKSCEPHGAAHATHRQNCPVSRHL